MAFIRNLIAYSLFGIDAGREGIIVNDDDLPHPDFRLYNGGNLPANVDDLFEQHLPAAQKGRRVEGSSATASSSSTASTSATIHDHQVATGVKGAFERPPSDPRSSSFLEAVRDFGTTLSVSGGKRGRSTEGAASTTTVSSPKAGRASSGKAGSPRGKSNSKSAHRPEGEPCEEWTVKQLKEFAADNEIDLGRNSRKVDILDTVLEASLGATM